MLGIFPVQNISVSRYISVQNVPSVGIFQYTIYISVSRYISVQNIPSVDIPVQNISAGIFQYKIFSQ
jgi:hypothetical protein